jgi:P4 family phage/plasmid primase-like protien
MEGKDEMSVDVRKWEKATEKTLGPMMDEFLKEEAAKVSEPAARKELLSTKKREAVIKAFLNSSAIPRLAGEFDGKRDTLGIDGPDGAYTCELRLGMAGLRKAEPEDYLMMYGNVFPDAGMKTPTWDRFNRETFVDDPNLIAAVRRILGYSITGETSLRKAFVFDGHGRNGKSTLCRIVRAILGDYGLSSSTKVVASSYSGHATVFAALKNKRAVEIPEIDHTLVLGENFKILTGNDTISGRGMRENEQAIPIRCKLLICANDNIKFDAASKSFADRLCVIPFKNEVQNPDPWLFDRLMTEAPGILASLIEEAKAFYADSKLPSCHAIEEATRAYVRNADRYAEWLEECYEPVAIPANVRQRIEALTDLPADAGPYSLPLQTMFRRWQIYADNRKEFVGQSRLLAQALRERGLIVKLHAALRNAWVAGVKPKSGSIG